MDGSLTDVGGKSGCGLVYPRDIRRFMDIRSPFLSFRTLALMGPLPPSAAVCVERKRFILSTG